MSNIDAITKMSEELTKLVEEDSSLDNYSGNIEIGDEVGLSEFGVKQVNNVKVIIKQFEKEHSSLELKLIKNRLTYFSDIDVFPSDLLKRLNSSKLKVKEVFYKEVNGRKIQLANIEYENKTHGKKAINGVPTIWLKK